MYIEYNDNTLKIVIKNVMSYHLAVGSSPNQEESLSESQATVLDLD